jgi:hypothetical protein
MVHDIPHNLFHVDKGIFKNLRGIINPRLAIDEYLQGKRVSYFHPVLFFLITASAVLLILNITNNYSAINLPIDLGDGKVFNAGDSLHKNTKYIYLIAVFLYAFITWVFFRKSLNYNYAEHMVANMFLLGWTNSFFLIVLFFSGESTFPIDYYVIAVYFILMVLAFKRNSYLLTILKAIIVIALQIVLYFILIIIIGLTMALLSKI